MADDLKFQIRFTGVQSELALNVYQALSSKSLDPTRMESLSGLWMWEIHSIVILLLTTA